MQDMTTKRLILLLLCIILAAAAVLIAVKTVLKSTELPILMYHHVVPDGEPCNSVTVCVSRLENDLKYLAENGYTAVLPRELASGMKLPEKAVMITFDDGYASNYDLLFPLLQKYQLKAVISVIVSATDSGNPSFCSWDMLREMADSGLIEIGSHTYNLHNPENEGYVNAGGTNGVQRLPGESSAAFQARVLDDIQRSYDRITEELGVTPVCFAYPYGATEPSAKDYIEERFPVTLGTTPKNANIHSSFFVLPRWGISMDVALTDVLQSHKTNVLR